jgi:CheY-like chemotaxis protein
MGQTIKRFLLVDDDPLNNLLTQMILKKSFEEVHIKIFTNPEDALEYMKSEPLDIPIDEKTTLFLDINMPTLTGWEFLEVFELFDSSIKEQYDIYILSSSVEEKELNRAKENGIILDFIEKPLNKIAVINMFS